MDAKTYLKKISRKSVVVNVVKGLTADRLRILMYHRFSDKVEEFRLGQEILEKELKYLGKNYQVITLRNYCKQLEKGVKGKKNLLAITVDDGFEDFYRYAFPLLKKYKLSATVFLTTDLVGKKKWLWPDKIEYILNHATVPRFNFEINDERIKLDMRTTKNRHKTQLELFERCRKGEVNFKNRLINRLAGDLDVVVPGAVTDEYMSLSWEQIKEATKYGIEFGAHTISHNILSRLNLTEAQKEIAGSKTIIENNLQQEVVSFAYPFGQVTDFNNESVTTVKKSGYKCAVTTTPGMNTKQGNCYLLKRISAGCSDFSYFVKKVAFGN